MPEFRYKAFICYSHKDESWARWLHRSLESYRIPRKLVGSEGTSGPIPRKLYPIFRDREELSSAVDLSDKVKAALESSAALIVVCSPHAVQSRWVNEEIRYFQSLGHGDRVYSVIVGGAPEATEPQYACFPPALLKDAAGGRHEPLAADARKEADGRLLANLKLISSLLGIGLEDLKRREFQRQRKKWIFVFSGVLTGLVLIILIYWFRVSAERAEELSTQRLDQARELVMYKLNELDTLFTVKSNPEDLERLKEWDKQDLAALLASVGTGENALINSAMKLRDEGIRLRQSGELAPALERFQESWALIAERYRRNPKDLDAFFELGQAEFWIGFVHIELGQLDKAEDAFLAYAEITRRLVHKQPGRADYLIEVGYILSNLIALQRKRTGDPDRTLKLAQSMVEYFHMALVIDPQNEQYRPELGESLNWLADAQVDICDLQGAQSSRQQIFSIAQEAFQGSPKRLTIMLRLVYALNGLANVQAQLGLLDNANDTLGQMIDLIKEVLAQNPGHPGASEFLLRGEHRLAWFKALLGNNTAARLALDAPTLDWQDFFKGRDPKPAHVYNYAEYLLDRARLSQTVGDLDMAARLAQKAEKSVAQFLPSFDKLGRLWVGNGLMLAAFMYWELEQELPSSQIQNLLPNYQETDARVRACADADMAARKAVMFGDKTTAKKHADYLLANGYREPDFIRFCKQYGLCEGAF